jgi:hypothetical protein
MIASLKLSAITLRSLLAVGYRLVFEVCGVVVGLFGCFSFD